MIREKIKNNSAAVLVWGICIATGSWADAQFDDPGIPDNERIVYDLYVGDEKSVHEDRTSVKERDGEKEYEFTSHTKERDLTLLVNAKTMVAKSIDVVLRDSNATVERAVTLKERKKQLGDDEIGLLDFYSLGYLLRGYPFGKKSAITLRVLGQESAMPLQVEQLSGDNIIVKGKAIACHHLTVLVSGMLGKFLPKAHYWYAAHKPHYLVKFEGPASGPGSPKKLLELLTYEVREIKDTADTAQAEDAEESKDSTELKGSRDTKATARESGDAKKAEDAKEESEKEKAAKGAKGVKPVKDGKGIKVSKDSTGIKNNGAPEDSSDTKGRE